MCFSAKASFLTSGMLAVMGIVTLEKIKEKKQILFASIPLIFSAQQFIEGILWLSLTGKANPELIKLCAWGFLSIAFLLWPIWIPISLIFLEKKLNRKKILFSTLFMGIFVAIHNAYLMLQYGVSAQLTENHILYNVFYPSPRFLYTALYVFATVLPFFISSVPLMWFFGLVGFISLIITMFFYLNYLISVWCFFAAFLSVLIYLIIVKRK